MIKPTIKPVLILIIEILIIIIIIIIYLFSHNAIFCYAGTTKTNPDPRILHTWHMDSTRLVAVPVLGEVYVDTGNSMFIVTPHSEK